MRKESWLAAALGLVPFALLALPPAASAAQSATTYTSATAGTLAPSGSVGLGPQAPASARPRSVRRIPHGLAPATSATTPPQASSSSLVDATPSLPANFNGVSSRDSAATNFGHQFEPPDQGLCVGNGFVVEMVNSAYTVYDTTGKALAGPFNVNGPFNEGLSEFTSDPRCHFDAATNTWFAVLLAINPEETASTVDVAVNTSGDPRTSWTVYKIDTTGLGGRTGPRHRGCPCFGDQPTLGIDASNLYFTTNEFSILGPQFNGAQVYALAKRDLLSHSSAVHFVHFDKLEIGGSPASSVQPALTSGSSPAEFFMSSLDPGGTLDHRLGVWALTERGVVAKGGIPKLSSLLVSSEPYGVPPPAEQKGTSRPLDAGDDRMQQVQFVDGGLWGQLDTAIAITGDATQRAGAAWFEAKPKLGNGTLAGAELPRQGYVAMAGDYALYPALQVTPSGGAAMVMTLAGRSRFPSAAYSVMAPGATSFGPISVGAPGASRYDPKAERWGDYSWAVKDPAGSSVWLATEYVPAKASQTIDGLRNWGTRILEVPTG